MNIRANWEKVHEFGSPKINKSSSIGSSGERFESVSGTERAPSSLFGSRCEQLNGKTHATVPERAAKRKSIRNRENWKQKTIILIHNAQKCLSNDKIVV
jgi:hypothetical protein